MYRYSPCTYSARVWQCLYTAAVITGSSAMTMVHDKSDDQQLCLQVQQSAFGLRHTLQTHLQLLRPTNGTGLFVAWIVLCPWGQCCSV